MLIGARPIFLKKFQKTLSLLLAVLLFLNPLAVPVVFAEGETSPEEIVSSSPTPTEEVPPSAETSPSPTDSPPQNSESTPSPTPTAGEITPSPQPTQTQLLSGEQGSLSPTPTPQSAINSGDANASSETHTTVNKNQDCVDATLDTPPGACTPPEGQTNCPNNVNIGNSNSATVAGITNSSANTGDNQESGSAGGASVHTGNATASGQMTNDINSNTVVATESGYTPVGCVSLTPSPVPSSDADAGNQSEEQFLASSTPEKKDLNVTNENNGTVTNYADIVAKTGGNLAGENLGDVDLATGDALAWLNLINFLNTNIVGSNFEILYLDVANNSNSVIDLNELWKQLQARSATDQVFLASDRYSSNLRLLVNNTNKAKLENNINVCAATGDNQANQNKSAQITTGNAIALANIINMVNANILGSKFFFGIINITGQFTGNLILPRPERFLGVGNSAVGGSGAIFENQNYASVADTLSSLANTGGNSANNNGGNNSIETGNATAYANDLSLINFNLFQNDWFYLLLNILGDWNGKTYGWSSPDAKQETTEPNQTYELRGRSFLDSESADEDSVPEVEFQNKNFATVVNNVNVSASTGGNQANNNGNGASIVTGKAKAVLNLLNFINLNVLASRWFMGLVNVLGSWTGNMIYAYPDLTVALSGNPDEVAPGDSFEYVLNFANQGYDDAENVLIKMEFPQGLDYEGDDSGVPANCDSRSCSWSIGSLSKDQGGSFGIKVKLDPNFFSLQQVSWLEKLIPKVYAADEKASFVVKASVTTTIPESDNSNNVYEKLTGVKELDEAIGGVDFESYQEGIDLRQPVLEITAKNNVNEFVYPKDIVTFEVTVKNSGEVRSEKTYLTHALYNGVPEDFGVAKIYIGNIEPGKTAKITFGITLANGKEFHAGSYHSVSKAIGYAPNGSEVTSNEARTDFKIKLKEITSLFEARALGKDEEKVLGVSAMECPTQKERILPYVLLFVLSALWIVDRSRRLSENYL